MNCVDRVVLVVSVAYDYASKTGNGERAFVFQVLAEAQKNLARHFGAAYGG
jgi:hypothetical protein